MAGELKDAWKNAVNHSLATLFDTSSQNFGQFLNLVGQGAVVDGLIDPNNTIALSLGSALWGTLIPWSWALSNDQHHLFIM